MLTIKYFFSNHKLELKYSMNEFEYAQIFENFVVNKIAFFFLCVDDIFYLFISSVYITLEIFQINKSSDASSKHVSVEHQNCTKLLHKLYE